MLIFDDLTRNLIEVDFRRTAAHVVKRLPESPAEPDAAGRRRPGWPALGVVGREVTLLPRRWEWPNRRPGGASVALRRLAEEARRANEEKDRRRQARDAVYRFISAMARTEPGFEKSARALFGGDRRKFEILAGGRPVGVADHAKRLAVRAFQG